MTKNKPWVLVNLYLHLFKKKKAWILFLEIPDIIGLEHSLGIRIFQSSQVVVMSSQE